MNCSLKSSLHFPVVLVILILLARNAEVVFAQSAPSAGRTVLSGVYTREQARRGAERYADACSRCHRDDLSGYSGLRGAKFVDNWREDNLDSLWQRISKTMPAGAPGTLSEQEYLDILAFILEANEFPAGPEELAAAQVPGIRFEARNGPEPVPDFALVQTVGCLTQRSNGNWFVTHAADVIRTRNPERSSAEELKAASTDPPGKNAFRILDGSDLKAAVHEGRKVKVKGFLIRKTNDDRLNTTTIEVLGQSCP